MKLPSHFAKDKHVEQLSALWHFKDISSETCVPLLRLCR